MNKPDFYAMHNRQVDAQLEMDILLFGNAYYTINPDGTKTRVDPLTLVKQSGRAKRKFYYWAIAFFTAIIVFAIVIYFIFR
jgi:hypothetical protein